MRKVKLAGAAGLAEGETLKFQFLRQGRPVEAFLAKFQGKLVAYQNICRHLPLALDYGEGRFFDRDGKHFVCQTHNAIYEPLTGLCVRGPCEGESLKPLQFEVTNGEIWLLED